jgi:hypothetical protein
MPEAKEGKQQESQSSHHSPERHARGQCPCRYCQKATLARRLWREDIRRLVGSTRDSQGTGRYFTCTSICARYVNLSRITKIAGDIYEEISCIYISNFHA